MKEYLMIAVIERLCEKAKASDDANDAMKFTQAAVNAANAYAAFTSARRANQSA